jgi:branched-subunit amino acid ABC-type transport system permease component
MAAGSPSGPKDVAAPGATLQAAMTTAFPALGRFRVNLPSGTLLAQSALSGVFIGSLYGLLGMGLGLTWGLLHVINLAHFGLAFLAAYLCYQLAAGGMDPLATLAIIVPLFFVLGVAMQALLMRFACRRSTRCSRRSA